MKIPRNEYPRPQFVRKDWLCLNGPWEFEIDNGDSGLDRGCLTRPLSGRIIVPFCPESRLSTVENTDFMNAVWYRRTVDIPKAWAGMKVLLHFGAVDYESTVWVNGQEVGRHRGGFTPFTCDLSHSVEAGQEVTIVVLARDDAQKRQPRGKQSEKYANYGCLYTRTTGIWQTVWMEPVPQVYLKRTRITPDVDSGTIRIDQPLSGNPQGMKLQVTLRDGQGVICMQTAGVGSDMSPHLELAIPASRRRLWMPGDPHLYDLDIELLGAGGNVVDKFASYAALRSLAIEGLAVKLNGRPLFQRLVLDQGYYPDGIMTAPDDESLRRDIELSQAAGFNGARLHQKVFEERFLYHADRLGYLCWGEFPDWSLTRSGQRHHHGSGSAAHITQWLEALERDYSHPCIVGWCGANETSDRLTDRMSDLDDVVRGMFLAAKAIDTTRPVLDVSGYSHRVPETDIYDCHDYESDPEKLKADMNLLREGKAWYNTSTSDRVRESVPYRGQPFFNSEFGGIWWSPDASADEKASWGYGDRPATQEEFCRRFSELCRVQLENPCLLGYCYTQLTDVFTEQNGIYTFDRKAKFDISRISAAQQVAPAIETLQC